MSSPLVMAGFTRYSNPSTLLHNLSLSSSQFSCRGPSNCAWQAPSWRNTMPLSVLLDLTSGVKIRRDYRDYTGWLPLNMRSNTSMGSPGGPHVTSRKLSFQFLDQFAHILAPCYSPHTAPPPYLRVMTFLSHHQRSISLLSTAP